MNTGIMASNEDREKHAQRRRRNIYAKVLHDYRKLYSPRIVEDKTKYKREKLDPRQIEVELEEDE